MDFTRTGKGQCKSELPRDLPSKAEATTPKKLLQMASGRSCVDAKPMDSLMDGPRLVLSIFPNFV